MRIGRSKEKPGSCSRGSSSKCFCLCPSQQKVLAPQITPFLPCDDLSENANLHVPTAFPCMETYCRSSTTLQIRLVTYMLPSCGNEFMQGEGYIELDPPNDVN